MAGSSFGTFFKITTFGESHGAALGVVVDGCPSGIPLNEATIQKELDRRRPGHHDGQFNASVTARKEADACQILSGVFEGRTTGTPIAIVIPNTSQHSKDYDALKDTFRPGHADYTYTQKYGIRDHRGCGRRSDRQHRHRSCGDGGVCGVLIWHTAGAPIVGRISTRANAVTVTA